LAKWDFPSPVFKKWICQTYRIVAIRMHFGHYLT
jgi:hypothetical protein